MKMAIQTVEYGGSGGNPFNMEAVHSVGVHHGSEIDALVLNEVQHGGNGGLLDPEIFLAEDEYISGFILQHRNVLTALRFFTSQDRDIGVSHEKHDTLEEVGNIRVLGLGGSSGSRLDRIAIKYIDNYTPSVMVEDSNAVINVFGPGAAIERFSSTQVQTLVSHTHVMEQVFSLDVGIKSGSALGKALHEFIAEITATGGYKSTTRDELKNEVTTTTLNSEKTTFTTPAGMVGLEIIPVRVFVDT
jgi:hypothetical protein